MTNAKEMRKKVKTAPQLVKETYTSQLHRLHDRMLQTSNAGFSELTWKIRPSQFLTAKQHKKIEQTLVGVLKKLGYKIKLTHDNFWSIKW